MTRVAPLGINTTRAYAYDSTPDGPCADQHAA